MLFLFRLLESTMQREQALYLLRFFLDRISLSVLSFDGNLVNV